WTRLEIKIEIIDEFIHFCPLATAERRRAAPRWGPPITPTTTADLGRRHAQRAAHRSTSVLAPRCSGHAEQSPCPCAASRHRPNRPHQPSLLCQTATKRALRGVAACRCRARVLHVRAAN